jgi:hypothetical protein
LTVSIADATISAGTGSASIDVIPGAFAGYGLFDASGNKASLGETVTANTPVELWLKPVDAEGNPTGQVFPTSTTVDLSSSSPTGAFRLSPTGADLTNGAVSVSAGSYDVPVYYVDSAAGTPDLTAINANIVTSYVFSPSPLSTGTITVTAENADGIAVPDATIYLSLTTTASTAGTASVGSTDLSSTPAAFTANSDGVVSISYAASSSSSDTSGADTITAGNAASSPTVSATDVHTY